MLLISELEYGFSAACLWGCKLWGMHGFGRGWLYSSKRGLEVGDLLRLGNGGLSGPQDQKNFVLSILLKFIQHVYKETGNKGCIFLFSG